MQSGLGKNECTTYYQEISLGIQRTNQQTLISIWVSNAQKQQAQRPSTEGKHGIIFQNHLNNENLDEKGRVLSIGQRATATSDSDTHAVTQWNQISKTTSFTTHVQAVPAEKVGKSNSDSSVEDCVRGKEKILHVQRTLKNRNIVSLHIRTQGGYVQHHLTRCSISWKLRPGSLQNLR